MVFINLSLGSASYHMGVRFWKSPPDRIYLIIGLKFVECGPGIGHQILVSEELTESVAA